MTPFLRLAIALALSGCAVGPNFKPPPLPATDAYVRGPAKSNRGHQSGRRRGSAFSGRSHEAIVNSTALYDYKPRAPQCMIEWLKAKEGVGFLSLGLSAPSATSSGSQDMKRFVPGRPISIRWSI
jgi:hypothetical protein